MNPRRGVSGAVLFLCGLGAGVARGQQLRVQVQFRMLEPNYARAFGRPERRRLVEDSAGAVLASVLSDRFRFFTFSPGPALGSGPTLIVELNEKDRVAGGPIDAVGLHIAVTGGGPDTTRVYWIEFQPLQFAMAPVDTTHFLTNLRLKLEGLSDANWRQLLTDRLARIPIADTSAAVWSPPSNGPESEIEWLIPLVPDSVCFDPDRSKLRVRNVVRIQGGMVNNLTVTVRPAGAMTTDSSFVLPSKLAHFRGQMRASLDSPTTRPLGRADSITVKAVYVTEYEVDPLNCAELRRGNDP